MQIFMCACLALLFCSVRAFSGPESVPRAQNVTWSSHNFKTILTWKPKPINYTYTVEFSRLGKDRQRNPHCIQISDTECDLTYDLTEIKFAYTADIISEPLSLDLIELPFTQSKRFCPYNDTTIGRPEFRMKLDENQTITLYIEDQLTALYREGRHLTIRDVFKQDLKYKIRYNKAGSTGTKVVVVSDSQVEMSDLDKGQSYCFSVAAFIPSRRGPKSLSSWSSRRCSPAYNTNFISEFGPLVLGGALLILIVIIFTITLICCCCCCRQRGKQKQTEDSDTMTEV